MEQVTPFELKRMFLGEQPPLFMLEIIVRVIIIYAGALIMTRYLGKRGRSEMTPLEYIIIFALGSAIGDPMLYPDVPITWSLIIMAVVVILEELVTNLTARISWFRKYIESSPILVIEAGEIIDKNIEKENFNKEQILELLREQGVENTNIIKFAYMEPSGKISIIKREKGKYRHGLTTIP